MLSSFLGFGWFFFWWNAPVLCWLMEYPCFMLVVLRYHRFRAVSPNKSGGLSYSSEKVGEVLPFQVHHIPIYIYVCICINFHPFQKYLHFMSFFQLFYLLRSCSTALLDWYQHQLRSVSCFQKDLNWKQCYLISMRRL